MVSHLPDFGRAPVKVQQAEERVVETHYTPIYVITAVFATIFIIGPLLVRKGNYVGIIRVNIMLSAFSMWIFWVTVYIAQMNPLMGPRMHNITVAWLAHTWGKPPRPEGRKVM